MRHSAADAGRRHWGAGQPLRRLRRPPCAARKEAPPSHHALAHAPSPGAGARTRSAAAAPASAPPRCGSWARPRRSCRTCGAGRRGNDAALKKLRLAPGEVMPVRGGGARGASPRACCTPRTPGPSLSRVGARTGPPGPPRGFARRTPRRCTRSSARGGGRCSAPARNAQSPVGKVTQRREELPVKKHRTS